ncbi:MAG: N-6 DNA methylase [Candidatus Lokiarchaeota archaeon]|nr:N-6 DNA methylase [Candidatus Lokiarchaeota archaeon]
MIITCKDSSFRLRYYFYEEILKELYGLIIMAKRDEVLDRKKLVYQLYKILNITQDDTDNTEFNTFFDSKILNKIDFKRRKSKGQFVTPSILANFMAKWVLLNQKPKKILDPAIGTGILIKEILKSIKKENGQNKFRIYGFDRDNLMILITKINLFENKGHLDLINEDFFENNLEEKFDIIIANPPYIKSNKIERLSLYHQVVSNSVGVDLDKFTGLYALFLVYCVTLLKKRGKLAFIIPSEFLNANYGVKVKDILLKNIRIEALIYFDTKDFVFNDVMSSCLIVLIDNSDFSPEHNIKFIKTTTINNLDDIFNVVTDNSYIKDGKLKQNIANLIYSEYKVKQLNPAKKWISLFSNKRKNYGELEHFIPLGFYYKVIRGIATGANNFFTLSESEINRWKIPERYLLPIITKARDISPPIFTWHDYNQLKNDDKKVYLLSIEEEIGNASVKRYLDTGIEQEIDKRYLTRNRRIWYFMEHREVAPVLIKVFNRGKIQFILNDTACLNLTSFHGIYPNDKRFMRFNKALISFFLSEYGEDTVRLQLRHYGGGLKKLEPSDVEKILIPDFTEFSNADLTRLDQCFEQYTELSREGSQERTLKFIDEINHIFGNLFEHYSFFEETM